MKKIKITNKRGRNPQMESYTNAVKAGQHVVPSAGGWKVKETGASKATKLMSTQKEAIEYAKEIARNQRTELFIHGKDGRIRERNSYGNDPFPPRG